MSAGILLYRRAGEVPEVLIAHMGGPFWAHKDAGAWSIPKGEYDPDGETALDAALREFAEELGVPAPSGPYVELGIFTYSSGKRVRVFAKEDARFGLDGLTFGEFELEWPPHSGRRRSFPEIDRVAWRSVDVARELLVTGQRAVLDALEGHLSGAGA